MKVAFVTPRYGPEIMGGAETGARLLAEHWVSVLGGQAEIFTTCASNHITWENDLPPGSAELNGVTVHRFPNSTTRPPEFFALDGAIRTAPADATWSQARRWVELNGPDCPALLDAVGESSADVIAFYPYLFRSTVDGIIRSPAPAILHPAAHDEPALYLRAFADTFQRAHALVYHSAAERRLVERVFRVADRRQIVLGLGIGHDASTGRRGGDVLGIGDRPYLVSVGRVDEMKGSKALAAYFRAYKELHPGPLALALVGPVAIELPPHPDIVVTGALDEADKWDVLHSAVAFVSPSAYESFSLVLLEAWWAGIPALVNAFCDVTREHCEASAGGLWFDSFSSFCRLVQYFLRREEVTNEMALRGRAYVEENFRWQRVIQRYGHFAECVVERG